MLNVQWKVAIFLLCVSVIQPGHSAGFQDLLTPMSIEFLKWEQCDIPDDVDAKITKALISRVGPNQVAVSLDIEVQEDFGTPEFTMYVEMKACDENLKSCMQHQQNVSVDEMCKDLNNPGSIIALAIELMGFPKGTKCPIPKGIYTSVDKKIDVPVIAMAIFEKFRFWDIEILFRNDETGKVHMCFDVNLERKKGGANGRTKERSFKGKKG